MIEKITEKQINLQKEIVKILIKRPQMPLEILSGILNIDEKECKNLVDDLEYKGAIEGRVSEFFLMEAEATSIKLIQDEIQKRLSTENIHKIQTYDLEKMLESALVRNGKLHGEIEKDVFIDPGNTTYIDKLLNYNNNQITNGNESNKKDKEKIIKTIR